jgi:hypothetical protein
MRKFFQYTTVIVFILSSLSLCQSEDDSTVTAKFQTAANQRFSVMISTGFIYSSTQGRIFYYSPAVSFHFNDKSQIMLLYRKGSGGGDASVGGLEPENDDDIDTYYEISPLYVWGLRVKKMHVGFGTGISYIWGEQTYHKKFNLIALPFEIEWRYDFSERFSTSLDFHLCIDKETTSRGLGLNFMVRL